MIKPIPVPDPWRAALVLAPPFPIASASTRADLALEVERAARELGIGQQPMRENFLQLWNLAPGNGGSILQEHRQAWQPEFGMGIWPLREPPQGWTQTSLMDNAAAVMLGEEPEMPNHRVLRLASTAAVLEQAPALLRGCGTLIQVEAKNDWNDISQQTRKLYLPRIQEERFRGEEFYLPLLDAATLSAAESSLQLDLWMCGILSCIRESAVDGGVLLVSRVAGP